MTGWSKPKEEGELTAQARRGSLVSAAYPKVSAPYIFLGEELSLPADP